MGELRRIKPDREAGLARLRAHSSEESRAELAALHAEWDRRAAAAARLLAAAGWIGSPDALAFCARDAFGILGADGTLADVADYLRVTEEDYRDGPPSPPAALRELARALEETWHSRAES